MRRRWERLWRMARRVGSAQILGRLSLYDGISVGIWVIGMLRRRHRVLQPWVMRRRRRLAIRVLHGSENLLVGVSTVHVRMLLGMPVGRGRCWRRRRRQLRGSRRVGRIGTRGRVVVMVQVVVMMRRALGRRRRRRRRRQLGRGSMRTVGRMRKRVVR